MEKNVFKPDSMDIKLSEQDFSEENRIMELEFHNSIERDRFVKTSPSKRVLFLPHCLRRASTCEGEYADSGFNCVYCNKNCPIYRLKTFAEVLGYRVIIAPGISVIKKFLEKSRPEGVVAVACYEELVSGISLLRQKRPEAATQVVSLSKEGCSNTEVDVEKVKGILGISQPVCSQTA